MSELEYLSIADFAEIAGISKQAVYARIKKDLAPYTQIIGGQKYISSAALSYFQSAEITETVIQDKKQRQEEKTGNTAGTAYLLKQLEEKDRLIAKQQELIEDQSSQIKILQKHNMEQSNALIDLLQKQNKLQENFQVLLGQQQVLIGQKEGKDTEIPVEGFENVEQPVEQSVVSTKPTQEERKRKRGLFSWFFR